MGDPAPSPPAGLGAIEVQARYAPRSMVVSLEFYFDESGKEVAAPEIVLAGIVASATRWKKMKGPWLKVLREPPSIEYFKMREAVGPFEQFAGWDKRDIAKKVEALARLIYDHAAAYLLFTCAKADYAKAKDLTASTPIPRKLDHHYLPCFWDALFGVAQAMERKPPFTHNKPLLTFDRHHETDFEAEALLRLIRRSSKQASAGDAFKLVDKWIEDIDFRGDDKHKLPLQAADVIAWLYNDLRKRDVEHPIAAIARGRIEHLNGEGSDWTVERLVKWRGQMADYGRLDTEWDRSI